MKRIFNLLLIIAILSSCSKDDSIESLDEISSENEITNLAEIEFTTTVFETNIPPKTGHEAIFFNNYFWIMGGEHPNYSETKNDLWRSSNGIDWVKIQEHTPWDGRKNFSLFTFQNKLWIVGGQSTRDFNGNEYVNFNITQEWKGDIWTSDNGLDWGKVLDHGPWQTRLSSAVTVFNDKLLLIGGHSTTTWNLYQDIYQSTNGNDWTKIGEIEEQTIGTRQNREGLFSHDLIEFNNKLVLLGGMRNSSFSAFNWVLESTNGLAWSIATKEPYWKDETSGIAMKHLRPFIFKNRLWVIIGNELLYSVDGAIWEKEMDLPLFNSLYLANPRTIVKDESIYIYGSFINIFGQKDTETHLIKLEVK